MDSRQRIVSCVWLIALFASGVASAQMHKTFPEKTVILEVRKSVPLNDQQPTYRDYIMNAGTSRGIEVGRLYTIMRKSPVFDPYYNTLAGEMAIPVGELKIIFSNSQVSVGRWASTTDEATRPILELGGFMMGDELDVMSGRWPGGARPLHSAPRIDQPGLSQMKVDATPAREAREMTLKAERPKTDEAPARLPSTSDDPNL